MDMEKLLTEAGNLLKSQSRGLILPEEEALLDKQEERPGLHLHDESNPFGEHRHKPGEPVDGPHIHTPQNPGGVHLHGEQAGLPLTDGWHTHENGELGGHSHNEPDAGKFIPVSNPSISS